MLFFLLIVAYAGRMAFEDWRPGPELGLLWFNSFTLLASSIALQYAVYSARRSLEREAWRGLLAAGALGAVFLVGQLAAWLQLRSLGDYGLTLPSVAFFYLITGLHAAHLAGGLVAWGMITAKAWAIGDVASVRSNLELCCIYWHFMLVVWLMLFGLLFSGNNMSALLAICGFR
jgi:cytochrome c oxidase subunit 3